MLFPKKPVVTQVDFSVITAIAVRYGTLFHRSSLRHPSQYKISVIIPIGFGFVKLGLPQTGNLVIIVCIIRKTTVKLQSFGNKIQILTQPQISFHLVFPFGLIPRLCQQYIRVHCISGTICRPLSGGIFNRHGQCRQARQRPPDIIRTGTRFVLIYNPSADSQFQNCRLRNVDIHIRTEIIPFIIGIGLITVQIISLIHPVFIIIGSGQIVAGSRSTAAYTQHSPIIVCRIFQYLILPVHIRIKIRIQSITDNI